MTLNPGEILVRTYSLALREFERDAGQSFLNKLTKEQRNYLITLVESGESLKSIITVVATCLTKKIETPKIDIRLHKKEMPGGYSGRTLDTKYVTPFFKKYFTKFAAKESGWLTRSIEQPAPFNLDFPGKIKKKSVKNAFLQILNDVEAKERDPELYLIGLFLLLIIKIQQYAKIKIKHIPISNKSTIELIIACIKEHFFQKYHVAGASRLPVIAMYSIYKLLTRDLSRYQNKRLQDLKSHVTADTKARDIADITILDEKGEFFEGIEIKHDIPIDGLMLQDVFEKIKDTKTARYYVLTTAEPNIKPGEETEIDTIVKDVREMHGCEIIVNGVIQSLKYYLRLLKNPLDFIQIYKQNLEKEFKQSTDVKEEHILFWNKILEEHLQSDD
jgi:DNA (cytosine-5)-methyltransferase 1